MNKKGFTLIELLAVIVILAIIALISVPMVLKTIEKAEKSAFLDSGYGIMKAAEFSIAENVADKMEVSGEYTFNGTDFSNGSSIINYKGDKPDSGKIIVDSNGFISLVMWNNKYCIIGDSAGGMIEVEASSEAECTEDRLTDLYAYKREITIDSSKISSDLTNFPLTVKLNYENFDFDKVNIDGSDVRFTDSTGKLLDYEVDDYSGQFSGVPVFKDDVESGLDSRWTDVTLQGTNTDTNGFVNMIATSLERNYYGIANVFDSSATVVNFVEAKIRVNSGPDFGFMEIYDGTKYNAIRFYENSINIESTVLANVDMKQWHTVRFEANSVDGLKVYLDGKYIGGRQYSSSVNNAANTFRWGSYNRDINIDFDDISYGQTKRKSAIYHVNVPLISSTVDTKIYLKYGKREALKQVNKNSVWDNNYVYVNHMNSELVNSITNEPALNTGSSEVDGVVGKAMSFNGTDNFITVPYSADLDLSNSAKTISVLLKSRDSVNHQTILVRGAWDYGMWYDSSTIRNHAAISSDCYYRDYDFSSKYNNGSYSYITQRANGINYPDLMIDGIAALENAEVTLNLVTDEPDLTIGKDTFTDPDRSYLNGDIDEIRISNINRSIAWVNAEYESMLGSLLNYGEELEN